MDNLLTGRCDGIGRRAGLKIPWWQHRIGSTPITGTNGISPLQAAPHVVGCVFHVLIILHNSSRYGQFLLLSSGELGPISANSAVSFSGQPTDELVSAALCHSPIHLWYTGISDKIDIV